MAQAVSSDENLKGALTYLLGPITGIIFLLVEKKSSYVRFHAMQSTILFGGLFILSKGLTIIPILSKLIVVIVLPIISLLSFILWIVLMWKAYNGEKYKLPYIGEVAEKQLLKMK